MPPLRFISSFSDAHAIGNLHAVTLNPSPHNTEQWQSLSQRVAPSILVVVRTDTHSENASAEFFHYGRPVSWCGSGLLAAAKALQLDRYKITRITANDCTYDLLYGQGQLGFAVQSSIRWRPAQRKALWRALFGEALVNTLESPARNGYTLLELSDAHTIRHWQPNPAYLCRYTQRALIITAKAPPRSGDDYVMRYFAPQYGNSEDGATGSANALLVSYWAKRLNKRWLKGRQLSSTGGAFLGQSLSNGRVELYGAAYVLE